MVVVREKTSITMKMAAECVSHSRTDVTVRNLKMTIDEPVERGGTNLGPSPTETLVASLLGCTNVIGHKCAERNGVPIERMAIRVEMQFDRRGVTMQEEVDVPFTSGTMFVDLVTTAPDEAVEAMKRDLQRYCPVSKVIRAGGTRLEEVWTVTRP
jgi:uncharacterized OsmC-like protein